MIGVGDKVVCVIGGPMDGPDGYYCPRCFPEKGSLYCVSALRITDDHAVEGAGHLRLIFDGLPNLQPDDGYEIGWSARRFRKLEDYRNEQELEYRRTLPQPEPTTL